MARVVRVLVEGTIDKEFDYSVPAELGDEVRLGSIVRVELHGRRVGGWVVADDVEPPPGVTLKPIAKVTGWGPSEDMIDLARWAAHRWAGRVSNLLTTASPPGAVRTLAPSKPRPAPTPVRNDDVIAEAFGGGVRALALAPSEDRYPVVLEAVARGDALIVAPSVSDAKYLAARLRRAGVDAALYPDHWARARAGSTVVGARAAAWAPMPDLAAVVLLDEHDEVHQEERVPTWHARDVLAERSRRTGVPCVLVSPSPTLEARAMGPLVTSSTSRQRQGWAMVDVIDRRQDDPGSGLFSPRLVDLLRSDRRVVCVLNRTGRARLLACAACGAVATCERCEAAVVQPGDHYVCLRCGTERPIVCQACGATAARTIRAGVSKVRDELEILAKRPVVEITGSPSADRPAGDLFVGTEAVLHQISDPHAVVFLDFDQELLAPRYRSAEEALGLLARASRLVGGRSRHGRVVVQTRQPRHNVIQAALLADPGRVAAADARHREELGFPPFCALAEISGAAAATFVAALQQALPLGVTVVGPADGRWLVRAPSADQLADALAAVARPPGRLRVAVDPLRI